MQDFDLKQYYIDQWSARKPSGASHTKTDWDERAVDWVRELKEDEARKARSARRVSETAAFLRRHGLLAPGDSVIDIGCGPGQFVAEFAKTAGWVTGTDISPKMCSFGLEYAQEQNVRNVDFVPCDFKTVDVIEHDWSKKFDLVFSSITPAMSTYEAFRKAESMSRAYCFQSNFVNITDPLGDEVLKEVLDGKDCMPVRSITGLQAMFNILCMEGCMPTVEFFKEISHEKLPADDELVRQILKNSLLDKERRAELKPGIKAALQKRADITGCVTRYMEWHYAWILWDVRQKQGGQG